MRQRPTKFLFLDIDGVLNHPGCYAKLSGFKVHPEPRAIAALNRITDATGAAIVVSSTWRLGMPVIELRELLTGWGVTAPVVGATPRLIEHKGQLVVAQSRGAEIGKWLTDYPFEIESFVILDDDSDMGTLKHRLVQTRGHIGLTDADAARAIAMLRAEISQC